MAAPNCFDSVTLKDYLLGRLADEQSDVIASHLDQCATCEATISQLDQASDTLTNGLREPLPQSAERSSQVSLRRAMEQVRAMEPFAESSAGRSHDSASAFIGGTVLRDYRLLEPIGSGGMGTVYKAVHSRLDRLVAVKLLPSRRLGDEQAVARFQREMRVIGQLSHPAIVQATDAGEVDGTHFLVMEYVEGFDLNHIARAVGTLGIPDACEIARQAALGLEYAHQQGIVHRDIKPSNLMLSRESRVQSREQSGNAAHSQLSSLSSRLSVKILDLGLALLSGEQAPVDELTTVGQLMGTLDYMAPEQLEDSHLVGPRADIYALAATLFRLLTGSAPFAKEDRKTPLQKLRALATQTAPPIRDRRSDIPADLAAIIDRALSRDPNNRLATMSDFAAALAPWCEGHDLAALARRASQLSNPMRERGRSLHQTGIAHPRSQTPMSQADIPPVKSTSVPRFALSEAPALAHASGYWRRVAIALLVIAALATVITIQTNKGQLVIETAREGIEVRIRRSGRVVDQFGVTKTGKSTSLSAGEYEIEFVGPADGLTIDKKQFTLKRGDVIIAKVAELAASDQGNPAVAAAGVDPFANPQLVATPRVLRSEDIFDRNAKGMESFEAANPDWQAEKLVREKLLKKIGVDLDGFTLAEAIKFLKQQSGVTMLLDAEALSEAGIQPDSTVTLKLNDVSVSTAMYFVLRPKQLVWHVDANQVVITTSEKNDETLVTRMYPVGKLLPGVRLAVTRLQEVARELLKAVQGLGGGFGGGGGQIGGGDGFFSVPPDLFSQPMTIRRQFGGGGQGQLPVIVTPQSHLFELLQSVSGDQCWQAIGGVGTCELLHNVLSVRQSLHIHEQIEALLRAVESAMPQPQAAPIEIHSFDYPTEADAIVRKQLIKLSSWDFNDVPLHEVVAMLAKDLEIPMLIDNAALSDESISLDSPITRKLDGVPAHVLLRRILTPLKLDVQIDHGVLVVTTQTKKSERLTTQLHDIRDLVARGVTPEQIIAGLQQGTPSDTWSANGGAGTAFAFADTLLAVRQTAPVHEQVTKFLASLRTQLRDQPEIPRVLPPAAKSQPAAAATPNDPQPPRAPDKSTTDPNNTAPGNAARYDGKSFGEWLKLLETERSPAKLAEAMEALKLLMHEGDANAVAETVMKLLRVIDPKSDWGPARRSLFHDMRPLFTQMPIEVVTAAVAKELRDGNARSRMLIFEYMMGRNGPHGSFWKFGGQIDPPPPSKLSAEVTKAILNLTRDSNAEVRAEAFWWLALWPQPVSAKTLGEPLATDVAKVLRSALDDTSPVSAMAAVRGLADSQTDQTAVRSALRKLLDPKNVMHVRATNSSVFDCALDVAAQLGPSASLAATEVAKFLNENENRVLWNAYTKLRGNSNYEPYRPRTLAIIALARMGKFASHALPNVKVALTVPEGSDPDLYDSMSPELVKVHLTANAEAFKNRIAQEFETPLNVSHLRDIQRALELRLSGLEPPTGPIDPKAEDAADQVITRVTAHKLLQFEYRHLIDPNDPSANGPAREAMLKKMQEIAAHLQLAEPKR